MSALIPIDVEVLVVGYLDDVLPDWDIGVTVEHRDGFIRVESIGGTRQGHVHDYPMVIVQAWHSDRLTASDGCRKAYAALLGLPEDVDHGRLVRAVESIGGPQYFPDPETATPRFQATVQLNVRPTVTGS